MEEYKNVQKQATDQPYNSTIIHNNLYLTRDTRISPEEELVDGSSKKLGNFYKRFCSFELFIRSDIISITYSFNYEH